jgi:hypothetical protein
VEYFPIRAIRKIRIPLKTKYFNELWRGLYAKTGFASVGFFLSVGAFLKKPVWLRLVRVGEILG